DDEARLQGAGPRLERDACGQRRAVTEGRPSGPWRQRRRLARRRSDAVDPEAVIELLPSSCAVVELLGTLRLPRPLRTETGSSLGPNRGSRPAIEPLHRPLELVPPEPVGLCERHLLDDRRRVEFLQCEERVAKRQPVGDDEDRPLRPLKDTPEAPDVARRHLGSALAAGRLLGWRAGARPRAVLLEGPSLELTEADVVQLGDHETRDVAAGEREVGGLARPRELARHAELDRLVGEAGAELPRLLAPELGEPARLGWVAADDACRAELALAVPGQDHRLHASEPYGDQAQSKLSSR